MAIRREQVRLNVKAYRARRKQEQATNTAESEGHQQLRWIDVSQWPSSSSTDNATGRHQREAVKRGGLDEGSEKSTALSILLQPTSEKQYAIAFLASFRTQFLPDRITLNTPDVSDDRLITPCASWVVNAYQLACGQEHAVLNNIMLSVALAMAGADNHRQDFQIEALHAYKRTLYSLRRQIQSLSDKGLSSVHDTIAPILSCHVAALFEVMVNSSLANMSRHVGGIGSLLLHQLRTAGLLPTVMYDLVEEYRLLDISFCLIYRRQMILTGSFKSIRDAGRVRVLVAQSRIRYLGGLLDIAYRIPPTMVELDELKARGCDQHSSSQLQNILECASDVVELLDKWTTSFLAQQGRPLGQSSAFLSETDAFAFPNLEIAATWVYSLTFKMHALDTYISALAELMHCRTLYDSSMSSKNPRDAGEDEIVQSDDNLFQASSDLLATTRLLGRSVPYFLEAKIGMIGRSLIVTPLESARITLLHEFQRFSNRTSDSSNPSDRDTTPQNLKEVLRMMSLYKDLEVKARLLGLPLFSEQTDAPDKA